MSFYIEKLTVTGSGKTDSTIDLSNGVNIIYGPSNTGKTYIVKCIDYMFGSDKEPIDISTGYEYIKIVVRTERGKLIMSRKIGENKINVDSSDPKISSGKYNSKASSTNYDKTINSVYTYAQSVQLEGQTANIGHLRGDFDSSGYGFYTTWTDTRTQWKTDEFKTEFDEVINALRSDKYGLLKSRSDMSAYARQYADSAFKGNYCTEYGFRVDLLCGAKSRYRLGTGRHKTRTYRFQRYRQQA